LIIGEFYVKPRGEGKEQIRPAQAKKEAAELASRRLKSLRPTAI